MCRKAKVHVSVNELSPQPLLYFHLNHFDAAYVNSISIADILSEPPTTSLWSSMSGAIISSNMPSTTVGYYADAAAAEFASADFSSLASEPVVELDSPVLRSSWTSLTY